MKVCSGCCEEKSFDNFFKDKSKKDGHHSRCKDCYKKYCELNKDKMDKRHQEYRIKSVDKRKQYKIDNSDKIKEQAKEYRKKNKELIAIKNKNWSMNNKEQIKVVSKKYRESNREKINKQQNIYTKTRYWIDLEYRNKVKLRSHNRQNLMRCVNGQKTSSKELFKLFPIQDYECAYCGIDISESFHLDHINPISKSGSNLIYNLILSCPDCNMKKHNKDLEVWLKEIDINYFQFVNDLKDRNDKYFDMYLNLKKEKTNAIS